MSRQTGTRYAVLHSPPVGRPRVVQLQPTERHERPMPTYPSRREAEAALAAFLDANPAMRLWLDGRIQQTARQTPQESPGDDFSSGMTTESSGRSLPPSASQEV